MNPFIEEIISKGGSNLALAISGNLYGPESQKRSALIKVISNSTRDRLLSPIARTPFARSSELFGHETFRIKTSNRVSESGHHSRDIDHYTFSAMLRRMNNDGLLEWVNEFTRMEDLVTLCSRMLFGEEEYFEAGGRYFKPVWSYEIGEETPSELQNPQDQCFQIGWAWDTPLWDLVVAFTQMAHQHGIAFFWTNFQAENLKVSAVEELEWSKQHDPPEIYEANVLAQEKVQKESWNQPHFDVAVKDIDSVVRDIDVEAKRAARKMPMLKAQIRDLLGQLKLTMEKASDFYMDEEVPGLFRNLVDLSESGYTFHDFCSITWGVNDETLETSIHQHIEDVMIQSSPVAYYAERWVEKDGTIKELYHVSKFNNFTCQRLVLKNKLEELREAYQESAQEK